MTHKFIRPLAPASPVWIVRQPPRTDAIEVVFVGVADRADIDRDLDRIAAYPWKFAEKSPHGIVPLADAHLDPIGLRLEGLAYDDDPGAVRHVLCTMFDHLLVAHAIRASVAAKIL